MNKKSIKIFVSILFAVYIPALIYVLFLSYRVGLFLIGAKPFSKEHFDMFLNLVPFKTEIEFFEMLTKNEINTKTVVMNIGVNLVLFFPMGMALPVLFENKFNRLWKVMLFVGAVVIICEAIQFVTMRGSADIDDVILNTVGSAAGYGIVHIKPIRKILKLN